MWQMKEGPALEHQEALGYTETTGLEGASQVILNGDEKIEVEPPRVPGALAWPSARRDPVPRPLQASLCSPNPDPAFRGKLD